MKKLLEISEKAYRFLLPGLRNKYIITVFIFLVWILFFDQNNMLERYKLVRDVNKLTRDREYYHEQIKADSARLIELKTSPENLEKFAREQYLMKKDNEDIFIIVEEEED